MCVAGVEHLHPVPRLAAGRGEDGLGRVGEADAVDAVGVHGGAPLHGLARARHVPDVDVRADGRGDEEAVLQAPVGGGEGADAAVKAQDWLKRGGTVLAMDIIVEFTRPFSIRISRNSKIPGNKLP